MQSLGLVAQDIESGVLHVISQEAESDLAYYLLVASQRKAVSTFATWLLLQSAELQRNRA